MHFLLSFVLCNVKEKAVLEIVMHKITKNGEYKVEKEKIVGHFSAAGSTVSAEGDILQVRVVPVLIVYSPLFTWCIFRRVDFTAYCYFCFEDVVYLLISG